MFTITIDKCQAQVETREVGLPELRVVRAALQAPTCSFAMEKNEHFGGKRRSGLNPETF